MLRVPISKARQGMVLALPIYHPKQPQRALLKAGVELAPHTVKRLRENGVRQVYVRYPGLELIDSFIDPALLEERAGLTEAIAGGFESVASAAQAPLDFDRYRRAVASLLDRVMNNRKAALFIEEMADSDNPLLDHASSVCFLSLLLGMELESYLIKERPRVAPLIAADPAPLGLAGLLHDVGLLRVDPEARRRFAETGDEQDPAWREHVRLGYELVRGGVDPSVAAAVLHHHQHFDGSGFPTHQSYGGHPKPLSGTSIHVYARVLCVADLFDRLRRPTPTELEAGGAPTAPVVRALRRLQQAPYRRWIDPAVYRALLAVAPPYPPGSMVTLSDGKRAVVTGWTRFDPCRPQVMPLKEHADGAIELLQTEPLDLRLLPKLSVIEIDGHDVSADNFAPPPEASLAGQPVGARRTA